MNSSVAFLVVAVGASIVGSMLIWLRHRKPTTFMSSIDEFQREMQALAREPEQHDGRRRRRGGDKRPQPIVPAAHDPELARKLRTARERTGGRAAKG